MTSERPHVDDDVDQTQLPQARDADRQTRHRPSPELERKELLRGPRPGDRAVRIVRPLAHEFRRRAPDYLVARERVLQPRGPVGQVIELARRILIGPRIPSELEIVERVGKLKGLAVFASDNISSSAPSRPRCPPSTSPTTPARQSR